MNKNYELELPQNYQEAKVIDAKNSKLGVIMNVLALAIAAVIMVPFIIVWIKKEGKVTLDYLSSIKILVATLVLLVIIVIHELLHGVAYKIMTHQKLTFGVSFTAAFCGVPEIYVYRRCAIISMLTPLVVISTCLIIPLFFIDDFFTKVAVLFVFAIHFGGCVGDLYGTFLFLFKFKDKDTLMNDTGPKQTFYTKIK